MTDDKYATVDETKLRDYARAEGPKRHTRWQRCRMVGTLHPPIGSHDQGHKDEAGNATASRFWEAS